MRPTTSAVRSGPGAVWSSNQCSVVLRGPSNRVCPRVRGRPHRAVPERARSAIYHRGCRPGTAPTPAVAGRPQGSWRTARNSTRCPTGSPTRTPSSSSRAPVRSTLRCRPTSNPSSLVAVDRCRHARAGDVAALDHLVRPSAPCTLVVGAKHPEQRRHRRVARRRRRGRSRPPGRTVRRRAGSLVLGGRLTGGADTVFDCVGSAESIETALERWSDRRERSCWSGCRAGSRWTWRRSGTAS